MQYLFRKKRIKKGDTGLTVDKGFEELHQSKGAQNLATGLSTVDAGASGVQSIPSTIPSAPGALGVSGAPGVPGLEGVSGMGGGTGAMVAQMAGQVAQPLAEALGANERQSGAVGHIAGVGTDLATGNYAGAVMKSIGYQIDGVKKGRELNKEGRKAEGFMHTAKAIPGLNGMALVNDFTSSKKNVGGFYGEELESTVGGRLANKIGQKFGIGFLKNDDDKIKREAERKHGQAVSNARTSGFFAKHGKKIHKIMRSGKKEQLDIKSKGLIPKAAYGLKTQDLYFNRNSLPNTGTNYENTYSSIQAIDELNNQMFVPMRIGIKSLPPRTQLSEQGTPTFRAKKGAKMEDCGCSKGEDGIDTDILKKLSQGGINEMRTILGMGKGGYTNKMKNNLKVACAKKGMKLVDYLTSEFPTASKELKTLLEEDEKKKTPPLFKQGGTLRENKILNGTLHSRKNEVHKKIEGVTKKGIPVVSEECDDENCEVVQHAEVEKNELVFSKANTDVIESYVVKSEQLQGEELEEMYCEFGEWMKTQILKNTQDSKDKLLKK